MPSDKVVMKSDLSDFYQRIRPYMGGSAATGFTPVGTVIAVFSETAPANYLICDGTAYNKSDYPELSAHLLALTDHSAYEVSGDSTKFKVPDLRGEFLRGTGTNAHSGQGSGNDVGVHQDATQHINLYIDNRSVQANNPLIEWYDSSGSYYGILNTDSTTEKEVSSTAKKQTSKGALNNTSGAPKYYMSRPTNTSVLFCIAVKNITMSNTAIQTYDTDEHMVATWIDGKPIYEITYYSSTDMNISATRADYDLFTLANLDFMVDVTSTYKPKSENRYWNIPFMDFDSPSSSNKYVFTIYYDITSQKVKLRANFSAAVTIEKLAITIRYTKTTD